MAGPVQTFKGAIWRHKQAHSKKWIALRKDADVRSIYDGFRHSYASYRIRQLKGNLAQLAAEMGNSPAELIDSYKRNVTDATGGRMVQYSAACGLHREGQSSPVRHAGPL